MSLVDSFSEIPLNCFCLDAKSVIWHPPYFLNNRFHSRLHFFASLLLYAQPATTKIPLGRSLSSKYAFSITAQPFAGIAALRRSSADAPGRAIIAAPMIHTRSGWGSQV